MFRRTLAWLFLIAVAVGLWYGARWFRQSRSLEATLVFDAPQKIKAGAVVTYDDQRIGEVLRVTKLERKQAVVVSVDKDMRNHVRTDSLFSADNVEGRQRLVVSSRFAIGRPVEDGAVIHVRDRKYARLFDKGAKAVVPMAKELGDRTMEALKSYDRQKLEEQFSEWSARVPEWKKSGGEVLDKNMAVIEEKVEAAEAELRKNHRDVDADRLRQRFEAWLESFSDEERPDKE
jgi:hypothetical protein